jgi:hypothetical protein
LDGHRGCCYACNKLKDESDVVIKNKTGLMAKGYIQQARINMESIHLITALATDGGWEVHHIDMKTMFLISELTKEVYARQLQGFIVDRA